MKNISLHLVTILSFWFFSLTAQEGKVELFTVSLSDPNSPSELLVKQISGSITVTGYDGQVMVMKAHLDKKSETDTHDIGLKTIKNPFFDIEAIEKNNVVEIIKNSNRKTNLEIMVPINTSLQLSTVNDGDISVKDVTGQLIISNVNGKITMQNVGGSASANSTNGTVKVDFNSIDKGVDMTFSTLNGNVEITFPKSLKADIRAKSDKGEVFADFPIILDESKKPIKIDKSSINLGQWVNGKINGGGPEFLFKTRNGDIMIKAN